MNPEHPAPSLADPPPPPADPLSLLGRLPEDWRKHYCSTDAEPYGFPLGHDHWLTLWEFGGVIRHRLPNGFICAGAFWLEGARSASTGHSWTMSGPPLTLAPSFRCHCGDHGWVKEGRWHPG